MNYEVAIAIPTLNEERFISRCLDSIIKQTFKFEKMDVMIIDGGSNDKTKDIVAKYQKSHQNIRFIENKKKIQSVAFNIGFKKSTAPYIIRLDAHAEYDSKYISLCIENLKQDEKRGNVGGRCNILPFNQSLWAQTNAILNHSRFGIGGAAFRVSNEAHNTDSVPFGAFPRKIIEEIGGMREDLPRGEDNEYNSRIRKAGYKIFFDPNIISSYFARPTLGASCKQMYANGNSIGYLYYIDREAIGIRHLVPLLFVVSGLFSIIISVLWSPFCYVFCGGLALYIIADAIASIMGAKDNVKCTLPLFILFFCVHVSYGMGTIAGLIKGLKTKG
ncbi:glycosyltransferase family 2 protein [Prevotella sp. B2-R-102]|uniref:glycosyltransferase family 2 protein n=1 Tax=Segatella intestinalis TaxID=3035284 RepID=UPI0023EC9355|nr:glycosyltransferase family 2 protein [Prevotella sp. B2-R-102]MDF4241372.1 glycosyltransferase family 2 protein [Prevotella sp. B2-R-102]